jgi:hypothetical protein
MSMAEDDPGPKLEMYRERQRRNAWRWLIPL